MVRHRREVIRGVCLHGGGPGSISGGCNGYIESIGVKGGDQVIGRILGYREPHVTSSFNSAHLVFTLFHVAFGLVIHI